MGVDPLPPPGDPTPASEISVYNTWTSTALWICSNLVSFLLSYPTTPDRISLGQRLDPS
jgi:hypothetical protein